MKLTQEELQHIIKEELDAVVAEKASKRARRKKRAKVKKKKAKKDACYSKVKSRYKVWPSAYASGALTKCRKVGAKNWGNKSESLDEEAEISNDEREELEDVSDQLKGAVKAHGKQAKTIDKALKKENKKNCGCGQDPCITYGRIDEDIIAEDDDIIIEDDMDESSRCTKTTKKASSTRKGKKWMKCVKSDSGGYKRIHWGQAGVRVTGKSGNTKRKKSFKARHGCGKAKANTPKGQACKDWAE